MDTKNKDKKKSRSRKVTVDKIKCKKKSKSKTNKNDRKIKNPKTLEIKTLHTAAFKQTIERIAGYISECVICFVQPDDDIDADDDYFDEGNDNSEKKHKTQGNEKNKGGITIIKLTEDHNVYIKLRLYASHFDEFYCSQKTKEIGVDMSYFNNMLKFINDDMALVLYMTENNPGVLFISTSDQGETSKEQTDVQLTLIELPPQEPILDKVEFENKICIESSKFNNICKKLYTTANSITICSTRNKITFTGEGDPGSATISHEDSRIKSGHSGYDKIISGKYDIKNLLGFSKCNKICDYLDIYFLDNYPLVLILPVSGLGKLYVFISPLDEK